MSAPEAPAIGARSAAVTVVAQVAARGVTLLAVVGSTAIVARTLDIVAYADWATVLSLVTLLSFALDPGITPVVVRRLTQAAHEVPAPAVLARLRIVVAALAVAIVCGATAALRDPGAAVLALALAGQMLPRALVMNAGAFLQVDHRLHRLAAWEAVTAGAGLAALGIAAAAGAGAPGLALAGFTAPTAVLALLTLRELRRTPSRARVIPGDERRRLRSLAAEIAPLAVAIALVAVYTRLHVVFVNAAEDAPEVARFLFSFQFVEQMIVLAGIVAGALLPLLASRGVGGEILADAPAQAMIATMAALGALVSAVFLAAAEPLTRLIGGEGLAGAGELLRLLSPTGTVVFTAFALGYLLMAVRMARRYLWINLLALLLALVLHALFTLRYGAPAAARIAWIVEGLVVLLAFLPVWRAGGRTAGVQVALLIGACVLAAEAAAAGWVPPALGGGALVAATVAVCRRELRVVASHVLRRPAR